MDSHLLQNLNLLAGGIPPSSIGGIMCCSKSDKQTAKMLLA
jgi:hypothetical protein